MMAVETAEKDNFEVFQDMVHSKLDECLTKLRPLFEQENKPDLREISEAIQEFKQELSGALVQEVSHSLHQKHGTCTCPCCGSRVSKLRDASRQIETKHGSSLLTRPYYYCRHCKTGFFPFDEQLGLSKRSKQHDLQELALKFLAKMPFEEAAQLFYESTGVTFSDHCMHELFASFTEDIRPEDAIPTAEEIGHKISEGAPSGNSRPVVVVASDGAHTPTRPKSGRNNKRGPGEYKEAKGFRIYLQSKDRITHLASWHRIGNKEGIIHALNVAASRIPTEKVRIGLIGDGAPWLWDAMSKAFPSGRQILDYYHVSEYIHAVGWSQYSHDSNKALHWVEATMARLFFKNGARHVIAGLKRMQPNNEESKEQIRKTINYLEHNKHRINYKGDRIGGYPIGSGGMESANKFICHARLKRSGAWWLKKNSNNMLALRCALVNGTFDRIFSQHVTREKVNQVNKCSTNG